MRRLSRETVLTLCVGMLAGASLSAGAILALDDDDLDDPAVGFCALMAEREGVAIELGTDERALRAVSVEALESNLAEQTRLQRQALRVAPHEVLGPMIELAAFDQRVVARLVDAAEAGGGLAAVLDDMAEAGFPLTDGFAGFLGFDPATISEASAAAAEVSQLVARTCAPADGR